MNRFSAVLDAREIPPEIDMNSAVSPDSSFGDSLFESLPLGIVIHNINGAISAVNPAAERMLGLPAARLLGLRTVDPGQLAVHEDGSPFDAKQIPALAMLHAGEAEQGVVIGMSAGHGKPESWLHVRSFSILDKVDGSIRGVYSLFEDVTARRLAAATTTEREFKLEAIVRNSPSALSLKSPDGRYALANPNLQRIHHLSETEIIGKTDFDLYPKEMATCFRGNDALVLKTMTRHSIEEVLQVDGELRTFMSHLFPVQDASGAARFICRISLDITERMLAEKIARENEQRLSRVIAGSDQGFWDWNLQTNEFTVSPRYETMLGYEPGEMDLRVENWARYVHPDDLVKAAHSINEHMQGHLPTHEVELRCLTKSGDWSWILTRGGIVERDGDGRPLIMSGTHTDINHRKATEDQLRKLSLVVEQSPESIIITNLAAEIEYVNEAFLQKSGYQRHEIIGQTPRILHSGKTPPETHAAMWHALNSGNSWQGEFCNRHKDGREFFEFATISPIRQEDGTITHYISLQEDITERKRNEAELDLHRHHLKEEVEIRTHELTEAKRAAEAATLAKSAFLANMSHEIRTPMNGILGMAHLLRRSGVRPEQAQLLEKIEASGKHLLSVLNDILDLSKIEAGKLNLDEHDFSIEELSKSVTAVVEIAAARKGLQLFVDLLHLPKILHGDSTRLSQALVNYLNNAIKFTDGGSIVLTGSVIEETANDYLLHFAVKDNGIGIDAERQARLFSAFEQADNSITRKYGGSGLGLAITRRIAELMEGRVGVDSVPGAGSTFWLTVRLQKGRTSMTSQAEPQNANPECFIRQAFSGRRILLVEDEPVNQEVAAELIRDVGLLVDVAEDGLEALGMAS